MKIWIIAALVGAAAGLLGALCGVGGGIVMVPAFIGVMGLDPKRAIATSMAVIIVTALTATLSNHRAGLVDWRIVLMCGVGAAIASWFGSEWMQRLSSMQLTRLFGIVLIVFGVRMFLKSFQ